MTLIEQQIDRLHRWIHENGVEKDALLRRLAAEHVSDQERGFISGRLDFIERELVEVRSTLAMLEAMRFRPEVTFAERPRMVKAAVRAAERKRA